MIIDEIHWFHARFSLEWSLKNPKSYLWHSSTCLRVLFSHDGAAVLLKVGTSVLSSIRFWVLKVFFVDMIYRFDCFSEGGVSFTLKFDVLLPPFLRPRLNMSFSATLLLSIAVHWIDGAVSTKIPLPGKTLLHQRASVWVVDSSSSSVVVARRRWRFLPASVEVSTSLVPPPLLLSLLNLDWGQRTWVEVVEGAVVELASRSLSLLPATTSLSTAALREVVRTEAHFSTLPFLMETRTSIMRVTFYEVKKSSLAS